MDCSPRLAINVGASSAVLCNSVLNFQVKEAISCKELWKKVKVRLAECNITLTLRDNAHGRLISCNYLILQITAINRSLVGVVTKCQCYIDDTLPM